MESGGKVVMENTPLSLNSIDLPFFSLAFDYPPKLWDFRSFQYKEMEGEPRSFRFRFA